MNTDIPTPETDAAAFVYREADSEHGLVDSDFARSLERRLAVAVEALNGICPLGFEPDSPDEALARNALAQIEKMKGTM